MSLSFNGFDVQPQLFETKIADRMIFPVGNFVHNTLNVCAGLPGYRIKRSGDFRFGYQHQLGMAGGFRFRGKYPAENRKVFQQRDTGNTADHIGAFDAADDKFFSFIADLNFRFKRRLVEPGCAVAVPAKQTRAGNLDRQYGRFPGNNRSYIQFKLETIGCLGCLRIAVFEREIRFLRQFLAAFQNFSVERGIRNGILLRVEKSGSDTDCRLAAVFRHDGSLCHHFCPASGTEEVQVFAVPFWIEVEEIRTAGVRTVDSCGKSACPVVAVTPARGKEIRTIVVLPALEIHNELPSRFYRVKAVLRADNEVVDCRYANLTVRPADKTMVWDDYEVGTWMTSDGSRFYLWNDQAKIMHTAGFRTLIANWTPLSHDFAIRYNFNPTALHHMGLGRTPEPPEYAKTGNKFLLIRKICLSNPAFLAKTEKEFSDLGKHNRKYGLRFCWMGDEQSITGYGGTPIDFCFSKYCLAEFRKFLKQRYGTLEKLNSEWKTSFASWDAVVPFTKEEVQGKFPQHVAGWADHLEFMDGRLENAALHFFSAFKKNDPAARTSISGTQAPTAYGGMDWYRQMKFFDGLMNYNIGGQMEIQRSFRPDGEFMPWEFGYAGHSSSAKIYRTLFLGQKGIMGFAYPSLINPDWTFSEGMKTVLPYFENIDFGIGKYYLNLLKDTTKVAVLYSQASLRAAFFEKRNPLKGETFIKYNALLRNCGIAFNYVATEQVEQGILQNYTHLILPDSAALSDKEMEAILAFGKRGGRIWAEGIPGYRNFNCTLRKNNPLSIICNQPGNKLLEKLSLAYLEQMEYPDKAENYAAMRKLQQELREFIGSKLLKATCDGKEITDLEVYARTGKNDLQSFGIITMNPKAREIRFQFPVSGHIYDALTGSYLGKGDTVNRTLSRMHSALFLVAPERFDKPIVKVSGMTLDIQNKSGNDTVYRIEVISPAGKKLDCYTQKLIAKNGKGQYHIPFALSDAKGAYTVKVIEVISCQHVLAKITL